ncbi:MAG TPA: nitroreductase family deazaflavin-dependent oxidoreductase [Ktedonobacteraceae bacterium]
MSRERKRIRAFNKRVTNPLLRGFARLSYGPFALIHHVGRRSGKDYETLIMVWPVTDGFVIALTYGPGVDWYRNLVAAGQGKLFWHKHEYILQKPEPVDAQTALTAFSIFQKPVLRLLGVNDFVQMRASASE